MVLAVTYPADLFFSCQAASTCVSRSGVSPDFIFAWRSGDCLLNQSSVASVVSATGRKVSPLFQALLASTCEKPNEGPRGGTHTGMSPQGRTFCSLRKSASAQVNRAFDFVAAFMS